MQNRHHPNDVLERTVRLEYTFFRVGPFAEIPCDFRMLGIQLELLVPELLEDPSSRCPGWLWLALVPQPSCYV